MNVQTGGKAHGRGGRRVLTDDQIEAARAALAAADRGQRRTTMKALAEEFGCHWRTIDNLCSQAEGDAA